MRVKGRRAAAAAGFVAAWLLVAGAPAAHADVVAYLVNVTVRPGYNFVNADVVVGYGNGICDNVAHGRSFADAIGAVKRDFNNPDDYQASYLITQAVNEMCPALIWELRNSAAHYRPSRV